MDKGNVIIMLRISLLICLIIFLITFNLSEKTDCGTCKFRVEEKTYEFEDFMELYSNKCINKGPTLDINFSKIKINP